MVTQIAVINFIPGGVPPHVKVSQGDTSERVLQFQCYFGDASYSIPSGSTVIVNGAKPGGTVFTRSATFSGNVVTLPCAEGMTDTAGKVPCEIMVTTSSGTISSANFVLDVEGAPANDAAVSASDLSAMTEMIETAIEKAGEAATSATSAAGSASQAAATLASTVKYSDIVNTGTVTATGKKALDAVQNNPNVAGTLANLLANVSGGSLSGTVDDNTIPTGLYRLNGASTTGTFPNDNAKYGTLLVVNRWNNGFQLLLSDSGVYERAVTSSNLTAAWVDVVGKYLGGRISIPANANLNTYTTPGEYYTASNATAASLSNSPSQKAGRLTVEFGGQYKADSGWIRQTYREYDGDIFTRTSMNTGSTWQAWKLIGSKWYSSENGSAVSAPTATWTELYRLRNVPPGFYAITYSVQFDNNASGIRIAQILNTTPGGAASFATAMRAQSQMAVTVGKTVMTLTRVMRITAENDICFGAYHTVGANINASASVDVLRLG